jgi:hypothetical protein
MITQCAYRALHTLVEGSNNSAGKWSLYRQITELLRLEEKIFVQGVCYFINKIPKFVLKKENVQNINIIFLNLRDMFKNRWATTMIE